jgi:predicted acetyltransferase
LRSTIPQLELVSPSRDRLAEYAAALETGWSPSTSHDVSAEQLAEIRADPDAFLAGFVWRPGATVTLADGSRVPRLPGPIFWIRDGEFCGSINLRFVPGSEDLPPYVSGHVGYAIVPWKRGRGYATRALELLLPIARDQGLPRLLATCDEDNIASRRVIEKCGGVNAGRQGQKLCFWLATAA